MPQPYSEPNEKEEITPKEYASQRDVDRSYAPVEYVTSGSAPQAYPSTPSDESTSPVREHTEQGRYGNMQSEPIDRRDERDDGNSDESRNWSRTTTGNAPQNYPRSRSYDQPYGREPYRPQRMQQSYTQSASYGPQQRMAPNVDSTEQQMALAAGGMLLLHAVLTRSRTSILTGALGAALLWHGQSRRSPIYEAFDVNTARQPLWERGENWQQQNRWDERRRQQQGMSNGQHHPQDTRHQPQRRNTIEIEQAVTVNRSKEELYQYWRKLENLPNFMKHLQTVEQTGDNRSHWVARLAGGLPVAWDAEIVEDKSNERIVWRTLPDAQVQQHGTVTFEDATGDRGTVVHVDIKYSPPGGIVGETFARMLNGVTAQQVKDDIRRFKSLMETGEVPTIEGQTSGRA